MLAKVIISFVFLSGLLGILGCHKHRITPSSCQLQSAATDTFQYDSIGRLIGLNSSIHFRLDDKGRISALYDDDGNTINQYYHDDLNHTVSYRFEIDSTVYTYNESEQIIQEDHYYKSDTEVLHQYTYLYVYANTATKNYSEIRVLNGDGTSSGVITFLYDNKKNPYASARNLYLLTTDNNVLERDAYGAGIPTPTGVDINEYTYNEEDYPITQFITTKNSNTGFTVNFTYSCK